MLADTVVCANRFTDNHDTGSTQRHWPFPSGKEETGYAYIMTHPGIPCVLWEHYFDYGKADVINQLIALRWACSQLQMTA